MIVSFTGAQSTGKTTLLNELKRWKELEDYVFIDEITRNVSKLGMNINEKGDDATQTAIMNAHIENLKKGDNLILDRCSLDGVVYTHYLYLHGKVSRDTFDYARQVFLETCLRYDKIFYLKPEFDIVDDGVRSSSVQFRDEIASIFERYIAEFNLKKHNIVELSGSVEERLEAIKRVMNATVKEAQQ